MIPRDPGFFNKVYAFSLLKTNSMNNEGNGFFSRCDSHKFFSYEIFHPRPHDIRPPGRTPAAAAAKYRGRAI